AFGGAGPLLGPLLARELGIREVIVPVAPAAFSAWGMLSAEVTVDASRTELRRLDAFAGGELDGRFGELAGEAAASLVAQGIPPADVLLEHQLDLRYEGQEHSLPLAIGLPVDPAAVRAAFDCEHERRYGHLMEAAVQILALRVRGTARPAHPELARVAPASGPVERARVAARPAWCFAAGAEVDFGVYDRALLGAGDFLSGPAIVDEGTSTTVVMSDQAVRVDDHGQLLVTEVAT
ncbi:MAG: hydantoinase/oxoprolinase family protein, partial [Actinobacteria bacterium]|nr:hydantoinase/oxoprolinase family protein [Actinomycetota bacterium]